MFARNKSRLKFVNSVEGAKTFRIHLPIDLPSVHGYQGLQVPNGLFLVGANLTPDWRIHLCRFFAMKVCIFCHVNCLMISTEEGLKIQTKRTLKHSFWGDFVGE